MHNHLDLVVFSFQPLLAVVAAVALAVAVKMAVVVIHRAIAMKQQ